MLAGMIWGCTAEAPVIYKTAPFNEKPSTAPPSVRTFQQLMAAYLQRRSHGEWQSLVSAGPAGARTWLAEERPVPCSAWYEYLRTGVDRTSRLDQVLFDEYTKCHQQAEVNDPSAALRRLLAGTVAYEIGALETARQHFRKAVFWMDEATDTELEQIAAAGRSDAKLYKGDAFERSMVHFYLGLIAYQFGEYDRAKREFARALLADNSKPAAEMRGRFALLHYWLGKSYCKLNDLGNARVAMGKARRCGVGLDAEKLFSVERIQKDNLTIVVEIGAGPSRVLKGTDWHLAEYKQTDYSERGCDVYIDGKRAGSACLVADMWQQASTQGVSEEQKLQESKATAKVIAQSLPYVAYFGVAWDVRGDIRSWGLLPGQILVWSGTVEPGEQSISLRFYDAQDYELTRYRQTWYYVPTDADAETVVVVRSARDKCNIKRKENP